MIFSGLFARQPDLVRQRIVGGGEVETKLLADAVAVIILAKLHPPLELAGSGEEGLEREAEPFGQ